LNAVSPDTRSALRVVPKADGVSIWSTQIFGDAAEPGALRDLLARAFSVAEVSFVELKLAAAFARIHYSTSDTPKTVWRALSRALRASESADAPLHADAASVYLEGPAVQTVRVTRIGTVLTTWHVREETQGTLRLWHPLLRSRRDVAFRLEEELAASFGVESFRQRPVSGAFSVRFNVRALSAARLARQLEEAWPRLLAGTAPPTPKRLFLATGLFGLAFTGQYLVPAVRPVALVSTALYSSPNALAAARDLTRGQVGLPALYTTGLVFMLVSGMPFTASIFATLMQLWPNLGRRKLIRSQRRLFAAHRRRPAWVRLASSDGTEVELHVTELRGGEQVQVRRGDVVPVDGVVIVGFASIVAPPALGSGITEVAQGDAISAGSVVRDGDLTIRVERAGAETWVGQLDALLPSAAVLETPSAVDVERIANRNAKPALALAAVSFLITRTPRMSQAVIRPDYATAPRLSVQLSALYGLAQGLQQGIVFKSAAALEALSQARVIAIDDSAPLTRSRVEVAAVKAARGGSRASVLQHAFTARQYADSPQSRALAEAAQAAGVSALAIPVARYAGVSRHRDDAGSSIEVATAHYLQSRKIQVPRPLSSLAEESSGAGPLWVLRNGSVVGVVTFAQQGKLLGEELVQTLKGADPRARLVYLSRAPEADVQALAAQLGFDVAYAGLSPASKAQLLRNTHKTLWIGDGSDPDVREALAASAVSASLAPAERFALDGADVLLREDGIHQLPRALTLARAHASRLAWDYRGVYALNLLGVAGAIGSSVTSLQAGLLSNAGTWLIYARYARALDKLAKQAEVNRRRLELALHP
jgi:cation-transporting P-type ATPase C